jgi:hypothetical protein
MEPSNSVGEFVIWHHIFLTGLSLITLLFLFLFIQEMRWGRGPMIESNWGGIGGGGGGWRMSSSLAYLLGLLGTATLLAIIFIHVENSSKPTKPPADTLAAEKKSPAPRATSGPNATVTPAQAPAPESTAAATPAPSKGLSPTP